MILARIPQQKSGTDSERVDNKVPPLSFITKLWNCKSVLRTDLVSETVHENVHQALVLAVVIS